MIYKITTMSKKEIILESEADLMKFLEAANSGTRLVLTKHGVVNPASVDSIVPHDQKNDEVAKLLTHRQIVSDEEVPQYSSRESAERAVLPKSPFAEFLESRKELYEKMRMLSPVDRTAAQEEAARETRSEKR